MNNLELAVSKKQTELQALQSQLEQQKSLQAQLQTIEQSNDDAYQAQLAIKASIESLGASIDTFAQQGINRAKTLIDLLSKRNEIDKAMDKIQKERLEMVIVVYHQILEQHKLKTKLDCKFKVDTFNVCLEAVSKYPSLFTGTPVMLMNFMRDKHQYSVGLVDKWKNIINA